MSENVSSNVLFHFTKSMKNLKSILRDGFFPHYCPEYTLDPGDRKAASKGRPPMYAAPLVCFCDLPLSLIYKHLEEYGHFGIGLDKEWGLRNGVAPVIYTHPKAQTRQPILRLTAKGAKGDNKREANDLSLLSAYTKPFSGPAWRNNQVKSDVPFYDEREWRYVPVVRGVGQLFLEKEGYENNSKRNALHRRFKKQYALPISPDDIQYLLVPNDDLILELHEYVMGLYNREDGILVTTAIMTTDRIQEDV
jgi:hypothetical protein